ncbi:MAG: hypothetical protein L3K26_04575, partial [Candidatus Hydrogenedentes bacterium]|nr:hypothetical protein [Candidatus Hydrogenedentota bacterium]
TWIWGSTIPEKSTQHFQRVFQFDGNPEAARLHVAVDDHATVYLNGEEIAVVQGWKDTPPLAGLAEHLIAGENVLSIAATTTGGLAGLLVRMDNGPGLDAPVLLSGADWTYFPTAPYGWPFRAEVDGERPTVLGGVEWSPYRRVMTSWPALPEQALNIAGTSIPEEGLFSTPLLVKVKGRRLERPMVNPAQRVGIQFEPWFTPRNSNWASSHAVPLTGRYWSWNTDVIRQQMIWLIESGIDFLVVDWTNHLWGKKHWDERDDSTNEIIHATTMLLETLATLRDEGNPVPTVVLYVGLNNGPSTTITAVDEELRWIYNTYVRNPRFNGLFEDYLGKPLALVHSGGGPAWKDENGESKLDETLFTLRYQSFQHEFNDHAAHGFWSWMDASLEPVPTMRDGVVEALTVSTAFFAQGGWKQEGTYGRRGGWTFLESFRAALKHRPRFLEIHQFQEFAGQWEGYGYGPSRTIYVDSYNVEFSDDIEPVSRTAAAYRGKGGWGFYYLNLMRALVDCYHQAEPETTVVVLSNPTDGSTLSGDQFDIAWDWLGKEPSGMELRVNNKRIEIDPLVPHHSLDLSPYPAGPLTISVTATGTVARYPLSYTQASPPSDTMRPATTQVVCTVVKE